MVDIFGVYRLKELLEKRLSKKAMDIVNEEIEKLEKEFDNEWQSIEDELEECDQ